MAKKIKPTPELLAGIVARVPEGVIHQSTLTKHVTMDPEVVKEAREAGLIGRAGPFWYDPARLSREEARKFNPSYRPTLPTIKKTGEFVDAPIRQRLEERDRMLSEDERRIVEALPPIGYAPPETLVRSPADEAVLQGLLEQKILKRAEGMIYDPLRVSASTISAVTRDQRLADIRRQVEAYLQEQPGQIATRDDLIKQFGRKAINELVGDGSFNTFSVTPRHSTTPVMWVTLKGADLQEARHAATTAGQIPDEAWQDALNRTGEVLRRGAKPGSTRRSQVVARSYTLQLAAKRFGVHTQTLEHAVKAGLLTGFVDPEGRMRIPAAEVEAAADDPQRTAEIEGLEVIKPAEIGLVADLSDSGVRHRLQKANLSATAPTWDQVRGQWGLPDTLGEFRALLKERREAEREARREEQRRRDERFQRRMERDRQRRAALRARLVAAFPTWRHERRVDQKIVLHIGPPNSGKTHEALDALVEAGSGWYLAPLRLLAFEIFDRLNQRGIPCHLLTGEEYIPVPGARFTAATIEMFNAQQSGECVIIDEAQMLADADRGWAWTRALMEAEAPEIHVIGPYTARTLIERLAEAAGLEIEVVDHERLAPIQVAQTHWPLHELPARTILVAFSRRMVLSLKAELERMRRRVSVVYGSLPPEVRRKQSERFAAGETEICVATDAVGMGLNLPADYVCFYEIEKFDGRQVRLLHPGEVQQIGGRAGRFGISQAGEVGATTKQNLRVIAELFHDEPAQLTHARVAPTVEDIELLPGNLARRLEQWAALEALPDDLRDIITTADLTEQIELARMLEDYEVEQLGLATAIKLINAPTRESTRAYWRECASAILWARAMPLPPPPPPDIRDDIHLEQAENSIACADIYLWLANRREFDWFAPHEREVRRSRVEWSAMIDEALLRRIEAARKCASCGRRLPAHHPYSICDACYYGSTRFYN